MRSENEVGALGAATDDALLVALLGACVAPPKAANAPSVGTLTAKVEWASLDALDAGAADSGAMACTVARLVSRCAKMSSAQGRQLPSGMGRSRFRTKRGDSSRFVYYIAAPVVQIDD